MATLDRTPAKTPGDIEEERATERVRRFEEDAPWDKDQVNDYVIKRQDRHEEWRKVAAMSPVEREAYVSQAPNPTERDIRKRGIYHAQYNDWIQGGDPVGFSPPTDSSSLVRRNLALGRQVEALVDQTASDPANYTYQAQTIQDVGWRPQDKYKYLQESVDPYQTANEARVDQVRTDQTGLDAQRGVLGEYDRLYQQGGLNAIDRARFAQAQQMREQEARGQREAVMARAEQQGRAGGQAQLVGQLLANQGSTNRLANDQLQYEALALGRRDALLGAQAGLGGQIQTAQDALDRFNTEGERTRQGAMAARQTDANRAGWEEGNRRQQSNAQQYNQGIQEGWDYERGLAADNTTILNDQAKTNVSAGYGARAQLADQLAGKAFAAGNYEQGARIFGQKEVAKIEADATKSAARTQAQYQLAGAAIKGLAGATND